MLTLATECMLNWGFDCILELISLKTLHLIATDIPGWGLCYHYLSRSPHPFVPVVHEGIVVLPTCKNILSRYAYKTVGPPYSSPSPHPTNPSMTLPKAPYWPYIDGLRCKYIPHAHLSINYRSFYSFRLLYYITCRASCGGPFLRFCAHFGFRGPARLERAVEPREVSVHFCER